MKRVLIVNADDCNLTREVTQAILSAHQTGIVSSTTFMINLPVEEKIVRELKKQKNLGIGLHLNVTFGDPVSKKDKVRSLLDESGRFKRMNRLNVGARFTAPLTGAIPKGVINHAPTVNDLEIEYTAQILLFEKVFGRLPTHLDTHHQLHDLPFFYSVFTQVARQFKLPVRRSHRMTAKLRTTDYFFGNFTPAGYWRRPVLETVLNHLPEGSSEIMCHVGRNTAELRAISSFNAGREKEWELFRSPDFGRLLNQQGIRLGHFGVLAK